MEIQSLQYGTLLQNGRYKIEKVLGSGTFGITYLATTKVKIGGQLGNMEATIKVAIKEFFMEAINGRTGTSVTSGNTDGTYDKYKKKFIKEARNMSRMNHPNIVKVSDIFEANNTCYYVMEYCEGGSLDELIKRKGYLGEAESMIYIRQIADALKYMHDNKMLHLDLKPGNVVLRENGDAVLIDFGLSKQFDKNGKAETSTNVGLGTPGYAPIEQSNYDGSTFPVTMDVYALGGTWFKMLTGKCPPDASTILNQGFPAYELQDKNASEQTIQCIAKAMRPLYKDRTQNVKEFQNMLGKGETKSEDTILEKEYKGRNRDDQKLEPKPKPDKSIWFVLLFLLLLITGFILMLYDNITGLLCYVVVFILSIISIIHKDTARKYKGNITSRSGSINGHDYVDLGLSVKWATCNLGASSPEQCGYYIAWGELYPKTIYSQDDYDCANNDVYDAVDHYRKAPWKMPNCKQMEELINKCTWEWASVNKVNGYVVTGPNGNSIFLPAYGLRFNTWFSGKKSGMYWSSNRMKGEKSMAYNLCFNMDRIAIDKQHKYCGLNIRPVV